MRYCLIGERLCHSKSMEIHGYMGIGYDLVELKPSELENFAKNDLYAGFNVTIPYKKAIIKYLDELDETAKAVGAVNTVLKRNGKLVGYNTDLFGMEYMLNSAGIDLSEKAVMILGTGGTSETAKAVARELGAAKIYVVGRKSEINYENCYEKTDTEVIINSTPVGMYPNIDQKPLVVSRFPRLTGVADCIYNPAETLLLKDCKKLGINCCSGMAMLAAQGVKAEEIWLGKKADNRIIDRLINVLKGKL